MGDHYSMLHIAELEADLARLRAENEALRTERDEARAAASLGCDANNGGEHSIMRQGAYKFCHKCGHTIKAPTLQERARSAEARAAAAEAKAARLETAMRIVCRHGRRRHGRLPTQFWGIIYLTPRDIRGRYLLMERIRRTLTRR